MKEKKNTQMKLLSMAMTNELALMILPFGTGYYLNEEGEPESDSLTAAMALQGVAAMNGLHKLPETYAN
ncbi:hypothetical protein CMI37_39480 [Candidatus Pacearchaeota archaeon]|nr:hypothetical protein [Candidatus Pacearchaeota archaeon]|tara:strand:- start:12 stop:218 length:207 start_codon:yes stop_codon:yes gene_type:complete